MHGHEQRRGNQECQPGTQRLQRNPRRSTRKTNSSNIGARTTLRSAAPASPLRGNSRAKDFRPLATVKPTAPCSEVETSVTRRGLPTRPRRIAASRPLALRPHSLQPARARQNGTRSSAATITKSATCKAKMVNHGSIDVGNQRIARRARTMAPRRSSQTRAPRTASRRATTRDRTSCEGKIDLQSRGPSRRRRRFSPPPAAASPDVRLAVPDAGRVMGVFRIDPIAESAVAIRSSR